MSEEQRQKYFAFYLTRSDENCPTVSKAFYQGSDKKGAAFWNIQCTPGKSYAVQMKNDAVGSSRILDCQVLKAVNGGTCFTKFKK